MTPQQRQEFVGLFGDCLAQACSSRLCQYAAAPFRVIGARPDGGEIVVGSQVGPGQATQVDWHVVNVGGGYRVTDDVGGGVGMKALRAEVLDKGDGALVLRGRIGDGSRGQKGHGQEEP